MHEYEHAILGIPEPELMILLDLDPFVGQQLVDRKEQKERTYLTTGEKRDAHEKSTQHLFNARASFLQAAQTFNWHVISCLRAHLAPEDIQNPSMPPEQKIRSIQEIHDEVYAKLMNLLKPENKA